MGKKVKSKSVSNKLHTAYKAEGGKLQRTNRTCPKCGSGTFLANHKDRTHCGKCGYTEKR
ncbi:30S ribosomal protein S27ae [Candidatus Woesearchaeota archaeon]|nr:30S ribosomal protein S27ae [Candidatus Woesearchaeota archaeon]